MADHDAVFRKHGNLRRAAANIHDHRALTVIPREPETHHRRDRLIDEDRLPCAHSHSRFQKRPSLYAAHSPRHAHHETRMKEHPFQIRLIHDGMQKISRPVIVDDRTSLHRMDDLYVPRRLALHFLCLRTVSEEFLRHGVAGDHRGFRKYDALMLDVNHYIRRPDIDADVF